MKVWGPRIQSGIYSSNSTLTRPTRQKNQKNYESIIVILVVSSQIILILLTRGNGHAFGQTERRYKPLFLKSDAVAACGA